MFRSAAPVSASLPQPSTCERPVNWISANKLLFVVNLLLVAAIVTTASINLPTDIKLIVGFSSAGALFLIDGVYYWRNRPVVVNKVSPIPVATKLSADFHALLQKVGYKEGLDYDLPIVKSHEVNPDISPAIYRYVWPHSQEEIIYLPRDNVHLTYYCYPDSPAYILISKFNSGEIFVGVDDINTHPDRATVRELAAMIARAQEVRS